MKKSLTINATRDGKKVAKSFGFVNPNVANSLVGGFAQMVNNLSNDTFVNSQVVKVMDTTEEEQSTTPAPAVTKLEPTLSVIEVNVEENNSYVLYEYDGDGTLSGVAVWLDDNHELEHYDFLTQYENDTYLYFNADYDKLATFNETETKKVFVFASATANYTAAYTVWDGEE